MRLSTSAILGGVESFVCDPGDVNRRFVRGNTVFDVFFSGEVIGIPSTRDGKELNCRTVA